MRIKYYSLSNDFDGKTGIVTFAIKSVESNTKDKLNFIVGYHLTEPESKFNRKIAKEKARSAIITWGKVKNPQTVLMVGRSIDEDGAYLVRVAWETAVRSFIKVDWAAKLDLGMKAREI